MLHQILSISVKIYQKLKFHTLIRSTCNVSLFHSLSGTCSSTACKWLVDTYVWWRFTSCSSYPAKKRTWQTKGSKTLIKIPLLGWRVAGAGNNIYLYWPAIAVTWQKNLQQMLKTFILIDKFYYGVEKGSENFWDKHLPNCSINNN